MPDQTFSVKEESKKELLSPVWHAVGAVATVPVVSATLILSGILLLITFPVIPFLMYIARKEETIKRQTKTESEP